MALVRGTMLTFTSGNDKCLDIQNDGTYLYRPAAPPSAPGRVVRSTISPLAEVDFATLSKNNAYGLSVLSGYGFTTHADLSLSIANAGWVIKTDLSTMTEVDNFQFFSPGVSSERQTGAIYNDGTFLYVGSDAYDPGGGFLNTKVAKFDINFGSILEATLSTKGSTVAPSSVDGDGNFVYFAIGSNNNIIDPTDSVVKIDSSTMLEVSKWLAPVGTFITDIICIPPKLYVGTEPIAGDENGNIYQVDCGSMWTDRVVISQPSGSAGMIYANGILYVANLDLAATLFMYDIDTFERVGALQFVGPGTGPTGGVTVAVFGPNTQNTRQYWGFYGSSPGGIIEMKNVYSGIPSTYPTSQQPTVASGGTPGAVTPNVPSTRLPVAFGTSNIKGGPGVTTNISSTNSFLQSAMMGDPHFYGFEGESFFFNGEIGGYYNLFSDEGIRINSLFRYWETSRQDNFTAMEEIGITIVTSKIPKVKGRKKGFQRNVDVLKIKITANNGVSVNDESVCDSLDPIFGFLDNLNEYFTDEEIEKFKRTEGYGEAMNAYVIRFWPYNFIITRSTDRVNAPYLNLIVRLDGTAATRPHGVVGQTADYDGKPKEKIDGEESDYKVSDLWASDFKFNKFKG